MLLCTYVCIFSLSIYIYIRVVYALGGVILIAFESELFGELDRVVAVVILGDLVRWGAHVD